MVDHPNRSRRAARPAEFHCSDKVGPLFPLKDPEWPMYSYERPAWMLWSAIGRQLAAAGWSEKRVKEWLQSKSPRFALDGDLGDVITKLGTEYADKIIAGNG